MTHGMMTIFRAWANSHETLAISSNDHLTFRTNGNLKTMGEMTTEEGRGFKEVDHHDQQMSSDFYDYEIVVVVTYETGCTRNTCMTLTLMATYPSLLLIGLLKCLLLTGSLCPLPTDHIWSHSYWLTLVVPFCLLQTLYLSVLTNM